MQIYTNQQPILKMLTIQELRQLQEKELQEELTKSSREMMKTKIEKSNGTLKESHRLKEIKRYIAVLKTVSSESSKVKKIN
jgi:ribosomal protein L29